MFTVELHRAHATPVASGHPWVFAQAVHRVVGGKPQAGDEVLVVDPQGKALGRGFWSPDSAIVVRLLTRDPERALDDAFFHARVRDAVATRRQLDLPNADTTGYRLVHAEGDGLAGLIVDVYGDVLVVQFLTRGVARRRDAIVGALRELLSPRAIVTASSNPSQAREGVAEETGPLFGELPDALRFKERGLEFEIPYGSAQKTGYYFDQREHRAEVERLAKGREVLDACSYVGGFSLAAGRGGAKSVLALDSSQAAVDQGAEFARKLGLSQVRFERADVRSELERLRNDKAAFDLVVFDPPKLVPTAKHLEKGRRAYRKLNAHAISLVRPGGTLVTCSCSAAMNETEFLRMLAFASSDAGRELCVLRVGRQSPDHPLLPGFSEGSYLKTVFAIVR
ncbi:MAG: class I SAM-dependent rRNA methyltransferase [Myxococcales bacterium]